MTSGNPSEPSAFAWDGSPSATRELEALLSGIAPPGTLRLVVQSLLLREAGDPVGEHRVVDALADIDGNIVAVPLRGVVRADPGRTAALTEILGRLRRDLEQAGHEDADGIEVVLDRDGSRSITVTRGLELAPAEVDASPAPQEIHDGAHHLRFDAPALEALRDQRVQEASAGPLHRLLAAVRVFAERLRGRG
ncbi:MAG TPA: hypothetical protein H9837_01040 [Candidatus Brachybacterium merdigallinarum]|nr:hypothetical protein [Candidatus Brachybacterium merdigallinarum]